MIERQSLEWRRRFMRYGIWNFLYTTWINMHVTGWENIPADGPVIMMGNHINMLDPVMMISFYPDRDIIPLAKLEAFNQPLLRYFVRHYGAIPVNRGEADMKALKSAFDYLAQGYVVMLYAEGHRSKTGLIQGQEGSAYLALKSNAIVVPVGVWGTEGFPVRWVGKLQKMDVHMSFGQPFRFKQPEGRLPRDQFRPMTDEAMYRIAGLIPEKWRGVYSDMSRASTNHLDFNVQWQPVRHILPAATTRAPLPSAAQ
jgi:1-acyl-sn-glycerol-3-phosphate acyltransferase